MSKKALQITSGLLGAIPVLTGIITMFGISDPIYAGAGIPANALLDSNLRFFGGIWFVLGLALYYVIPRIEHETLVFRIIWGMIFVGGIGRLLSIVLVGLPPVPFIGFTVLEIVGAPLFIAWQSRVSHEAQKSD
jgi:predicted membrane channel-forming protein YqfA (hemolysin III family)